MKSPASFFKDKTVYIMGLGLQGGGLGVAKFLAPLVKKLIISDLKKITPPLKNKNIIYDFGQHSHNFIKQADLVIPNPAVSFDSPDLLFAQKFLLANKEGCSQVIGESALFAQFCSVPIIGITGTRGKTTTTTLIYEILNQAFPDQIILAGNVPQKPCLPLLDQITSQTKFIVLELSSFQLHYWHQIKKSPHISVWTNLYPDHLDRYSSMSAYAADKQAIHQYQAKKDLLIKDPSPQALPKNWQLKIPGQHNRANAAAALKVAQALNIPDQLSKKIITNFSGVPYRLQTIAVKNKITYINDTTSTTPTACIKAIQTTSSTPTILILGGSDKKLPLKKLITVIKQADHLKKIILLGGNGTDQIKPYLPPNLITPIFSDFTLALKKASELAQPGDTILLSPGFASFSMFDNEFHRGDLFNQYAQNLPA
jgi:UDP-N-acetylmuramoylalanine--D-glutamate ligase